MVDPARSRRWGTLRPHNLSFNPDTRPIQQVQRLCRLVVSYGKLQVLFADESGNDVADRSSIAGFQIAYQRG
jgi:hypothetical protein